MNLHVERQEGQGPEGRWGRWHVVVQETGVVVGTIDESREWLGDHHGPSRYEAATLVAARGAIWRSGPRRTPALALAALSQHLERFL